MAQYGTGDYYEEKVAEAETRVELMRYAIVHRIQDSRSEIDAEQLYIACKVFIDAYDDANEAKERYDVYCGNENGSKEGT